MTRKTAFFVLISFLVLNSFAYSRQVSRTDFIKEINKLFLKGSYNSLIEKTKNLKAPSLSRKEKKELLYLKGLSYIELGNFENARETFNDILSMKGDEFRQEAHIGIADSYFKEEKFDKAIEAYQDVLTIYPRSDRLSSIYYNLGLSYKAINDFDKANYYLEKIKEEYNESFEAGKAAYLPTEKEESNYYIIQFGVFRSLKNAKKLAKQLSRKGHDCYIQKVIKDDDILYKVRGGKFSNEYYAMRLVRRLKKDGFSAKVIVE